MTWYALSHHQRNGDEAQLLHVTDKTTETALDFVHFIKVIMVKIIVITSQARSDYRSLMT